MEPIILKQENLNISDETYLCFYINPFDYTAEDIKKIKTDLERFFNRQDKIIILPDNIRLELYSQEEMSNLLQSYNKVLSQLNNKNDKK